MRLTTNPSATVYQGPPIKVDTISASSLNTFLACGLHWRLEKVDRLEYVKPKHVALFFGGAVHKSLEPHWKGRDSQFKQVWDRYQHVPMDFGNDRDSWLSYFSKGSKMIAGIVNTTKGLFDPAKSNVELPAQLNLGYVRLLRIIDVLTYAKKMPILVDGSEIKYTGPVLFDLKTSARRYNDKAAQYAQQLMTYAIPSEKMPFQPELFVFVVATKTLKPEIQLIGTHYDNDDIKWQKTRFKYAISLMRAGIFIQNKSSEACRWCDFRALCYKWDGWQEMYRSRKPAKYDKDGRRIDDDIPGLTKGSHG